jgi:hypothetical protein
MLTISEPAEERFPAAATLAISLMKGDGGFERLTRIEQRLERSIHRNMDELRKLRKLNDEVSSLRPSLRPCPFLSESAEVLAAEPEAEQGVEEAAAPQEPSVQNEANADASSKEQIADARQDRAEYDPTPLSTAAPRAGRPCHKGDAEAQRAGSPCYEADAEASRVGNACKEGESTRPCEREEAAIQSPAAEVTAPSPVERHTIERGHDHAR